MSYKTKRALLLLLALVAMPMMLASSCDDDGGEVPEVTGTDAADELIDDTRDAGEDVTSVADTLWCMDKSYSYQIRCGGDGVAPLQ